MTHTLIKLCTFYLNISIFSASAYTSICDAIDKLMVNENSIRTNNKYLHIQLYSNLQTQTD